MPELLGFLLPDLIGFLFIAPTLLMVGMVWTDLYDSWAAKRQLRRLQRDGELPRHWYADDSATEPAYHLVGASGFQCDRSTSTLRDRHRRRLELAPRGRFGFAAKWYPQK
ncbi:MAG: hypothetical protein AAF560_31060 [Acidobacteriota bacterium]